MERKDEPRHRRVHLVQHPDGVHGEEERTGLHASAGKARSANARIEQCHARPAHARRRVRPRDCGTRPARDGIQAAKRPDRFPRSRALRRRAELRGAASARAAPQRGVAVHGLDTVRSWPKRSCRRDRENSAPQGHQEQAVGAGTVSKRVCLP